MQQAPAPQRAWPALAPPAGKAADNLNSTPLIAGRDFIKEEAEPVAIVSRSLADRIRKLGHDPVGTRIRLGRGGAGPWLRRNWWIATPRDSASAWLF